MADTVLSEAEHAVAESIDRETALAFLEHKDERKRAMGRAALERLGASAGELILDRLRAEAKKRKRKQRFVWWAFGIYGGMLILFLLIWLVSGITTGQWRDFPWQLFQVFSYAGILGSVGAASQFQKSATELLAKFDDVRFVPDLVNALEYNDQHMISVAKDALTDLLPRLTATHAELLDTEQRRILHRFIQVEKKKKVDFGLAVLRSLEQVGDERDLPVVKRWADRTTEKPPELELKRAALACLPYVEKRVERNRAANTLLRAASEGGTDTLLRPTSSSPQPDSTGLLRPISDSPGQAAPQPLESEDSQSIELRNLS